MCAAGTHIHPHKPTPTQKPAMNESEMNNYTNTNQGICVSATVSAMDARSAATHTKSASSHLDLNLGTILSFPFFSSPAINNAFAQNKK